MVIGGNSAVNTAVTYLFQFEYHALTDRLAAVGSTKD